MEELVYTCLRVLTERKWLAPLPVRGEDIEHFADVGTLDDNVESFLSPDDGDGRDLFGTLKRNSSNMLSEASK
ncbi:hypothetical protein OIU76_030306, partial [Salix suchowensis]